MEDDLRVFRSAELALTFATRCHEGTNRTGLQEPYIQHPIRVAHAALQANLSTHAVTAALLHDVVEDCGVTFEQLQTMGFDPQAVHLVRLLTKWWRDSEPSQKPEYYAQILASPIATALKLLDRADNLRDMARVTKTRYRWALNYLRKTTKEFPPLVEGCRYPEPVRQFTLALLELQAAIYN